MARAHGQVRASGKRLATPAASRQPPAGKKNSVHPVCNMCIPALAKRDVDAAAAIGRIAIDEDS